MKDMTHIYLKGLIFIAALTPTGGSNLVTQRYIRHFNTVYLQPFESSSMQRIYDNILEWFFINNDLSRSIQSMKEDIVQSTIQFYNGVKIEKGLRPTPMKSHYVYNLRDVSKIFQGIAKSKAQSFRDNNDFIKLWAHECLRVFQDRLVSTTDRDLLQNILKELIFRNFRVRWKQIVLVEPLLWSSFVPTIVPEGETKCLSNIYCELTDREKLSLIAKKHLSSYNKRHPGKKMDIVLFE